MRSTCSAAHLWPTVGQKRYFFATSFNFPGSHNAKLQVATRAMNYPLEVPEICSQRRLVVSTFYASHQASSFPAILHNLTNWQGAVARAHTHTHTNCVAYCFCSYILNDDFSSWSVRHTTWSVLFSQKIPTCVVEQVMTEDAEALCPRACLLFRASHNLIVMAVACSLFGQRTKKENG
jgi:hypothetical protein